MPDHMFSAYGPAKSAVTKRGRGSHHFNTRHKCGSTLKADANATSLSKPFALKSLAKLT